MFRKKGIILLVILVIGLTINPAFALASGELVVETDSVQPMWSHVSSFANLFDISAGGKATVNSLLYAYNVDSIRVQANLQQFKGDKWTTIKTWSNTSTDSYCGLQGTWYLVSGYTYRVITTGAVYNGNQLLELVSYTSPLRKY